MATAPAPARRVRVVTYRRRTRSAHTWRDRGVCYVRLRDTGNDHLNRPSTPGPMDTVYHTSNTMTALRAARAFVDRGIIPHGGTT